MKKLKLLTEKIKKFRLTKIQKIIILAVLIGLVIFAPYLITDNYILHIFILCGIYACLTLSLNLIIGWSGQFSLGHVCFYGMGAYMSTLLMTQTHMNYFPATIISTVVIAIFAMLLCLPTMKLRGDYLAVITLGFGEVFRLFLTNSVEITKGPAGIPNIPDPVIFGYEISSKQAYFYFVAIIVALFIIFMKRFNNSGFGMAMMVVNEDDIAATALGINVKKYKILGFALGGGMAAFIGSFYAVYMGMISPTSFAYAESIKMVSMVVLGGIGSIPGSILGAVLLTALPEVLRAFSEYRMVIYGALMVVMMIFRPEGIWARSSRMLNEYKIKAYENFKRK